MFQTENAEVAGAKEIINTEDVLEFYIGFKLDGVEVRTIPYMY